MARTAAEVVDLGFQVDPERPVCRVFRAYPECPLDRVDREGSRRRRSLLAGLPR